MAALPFSRAFETVGVLVSMSSQGWAWDILVLHTSGRSSPWVGGRVGGWWIAGSLWVGHAQLSSM
jgi:hypothetical protein